MKEKKLKGILVSLLLLCSYNVWGYDFEVDGIYYNIISTSDSTVGVTYKDYNVQTPSYVGIVVIPKEVTYEEVTYSVTSLGSYVFSSCDCMTDIIIPKSITTIGESAFQGCSNLAELTIPDNVTSIDKGAFANCVFDNLYLYGRLESYQDAFTGMSCDTMYVFENQIEKIQQYWSETIIPFEQAYTLSAEEVYPRSIVLDTSLNYSQFSGTAEILHVEVGGKEYITPDSPNMFIAADLLPSTSYTCKWIFSLNSDEEITNEMEVVTKAFYNEATLLSTTNSSATFSITLNKDEYSSLPDEYGLVYDSIYYPADIRGDVTIIGLKASTKYDFELYAKYGENVVIGTTITITTKDDI